MITTTLTRKLSFYGQGSKLFSIYLVNMILTVVTFGLYYPWAKVAIMKYMYEETELEGSRFIFHGTGKEMFIGFIKAVAIFGGTYALIVLGGIYGGSLVGGLLTLAFYALLLVFIPIAIHGSMKYRMSRTSWRGIHFGYRGDRNELMKKFVRDAMLTLITFGIYGAWMSVNLRRYVMEHIRFGNIEFRYVGQGDDYFLLHLKGYFLSIFTLGIYSFWYARDLFNFWINNTQLVQGSRYAKLRSTATGGDYFMLVVPNLLLIVFTLGLGTPWAMIRTMNFVFDKVSIEGDLDLDRVQQTEGAYKDATGVEVADMLDIDLV
jgi:uncharacterized membrane protein YjgN (DUF898 family)